MLFWIAVVITMFLSDMDLTIVVICILILAFFNAELILFRISYELKFSMDSCNVMTNWLNLLSNFGLMIFAWLISFQPLFAFFVCSSFPAMLAYDDKGFLVLLDVFVFVFAFAELTFAKLAFAELAFAKFAFAEFDMCGICGTVDVILKEFCLIMLFVKLSILIFNWTISNVIVTVMPEIMMLYNWLIMWINWSFFHVAFAISNHRLALLVWCM